MKHLFLTLGVATLLLGLCSCDTYVGGYAGGPGYRPGYYRPGYAYSGYRSYPYYSGYRSGGYAYRSGSVWNSPSYSRTGTRSGYVSPRYPSTYYRSSSYRGRDNDRDWSRTRSSWDRSRGDWDRNRGDSDRSRGDWSRSRGDWSRNRTSASTNTNVRVGPVGVSNTNLLGF